MDSKWIEGYEGLYKITSDGDVISYKWNKIKYLKHGIDSHGYPYVVLRKNNMPKSKWIHRLVAEAFIPNPNNYPQVNHIDCNPLNRSVSNLEWVSCSQNRVHARDKSRLNYLCKIDINIANKIRELYKTGDYLQKEIARMFDISASQICNIISNKKWKVEV